MFCALSDGGYADGHLLEDIKQNPDGIKRCKSGDTVLARTSSYGNTVLIVDTRKDRPGIDDIAYITRADGIEDLCASLAELVTQPAPYAVILEVQGGHCCGLDIEAHIVETLCERKCFLLILIRKGEGDGSVILELDARCNECLVHRTVQEFVVADCFARRLHLG